MRKLALCLALAACAATAWSLDFDKYGLENKGERTEDGVAYTVLVDSAGSEILFRALAEPSEERLSAMATMAASVRGWKSLEIAAVRAVNESDRLQIVVIPRDFSFGGADLAPSVPGGLVFYFVTAPEYDFRVKSGDYAIRLRGLLTSEDDLVSTIASAVKDPVAFLAARDPQYAIRRINELTKSIAALQAALDQEVERSKAALGEERAKTAAALEAQAAATKTALGEAAAAAKAAADRQGERDSAALRRADALETALMATMNKGFFGGPKFLPAEAVAKLVELKAATPGLSRTDAAAALKAANVTLSAKEIDIVFVVKFGELPPAK